MEITGALHIHSTHSYDGKVPLARLRELALARGLRFLCMTEHTDTLTSETATAFVHECAALSDEQFVFIPGFEVPYKDAHVLHIGAANFVSPVADAAQLSQWRHAASLVILAHPVRNKFTVDEPLAAVLDGVEIWNGQYDGVTVWRPRAARLLETLREANPSLIAMAGLDLHREEHFGQPTVTLTVQEFSTSAILEALKSGAFTIAPSTTVPVQGREPLMPHITLALRVRSAWSTFVIAAGKVINRSLRALGIKLPRQWVAKVRQRV